MRDSTGRCNTIPATASCGSGLLIDSEPMRIPIPAIVVPLVVLLPYLFVPGLKEGPWTASRIGGAMLAVVGYSMFVTARLQLGKSFAVTPQARELVTLGLYSRIRNPIYVFVDVMIFRLDPCASPVLVVHAFSAIGGHACVSCASGSQGLTRKVWPSLPQLPQPNLVLTLLTPEKSSLGSCRPHSDDATSSGVGKQ